MHQSHLTHHIKIPPPLASTCTVSSSTSYQNPTPSGKYMHSLILHIISKSHPLWQVHAQSHLTHHIKIPPPLASTCTVSSSTSYQNPTPSGKYMHSLILHIISKSHPPWQVHAQSHLTHHIKIPPPLASTCTVSSYTSYQNPTPSGNYMHSLIFHVISKSHPLWQVHAHSHLTHHIKIPPPLASTCTVSSSTSSQNPTPSGKYMHSLIFHVISKSHPLWQVHAQSHLTHHIKIPPPLASTCTVSSYTSYQNPTPSGKYMHQSHLPRHLKIPPPLASTCTVSSSTSYQNPTPSGKYMHSLIFHVISKSHPLWQVHAQSHLTHHIKIPPPLASTCTVSSSTSYQNPTPSGKYMHSLILHIISKSHPLWQVHAQSHLTHHIKIPPPLASTCTISSSTSYQNPTPSGKYMHSLIFHVISEFPPPLASTCTVSSYTSYQNPTPSGKYMHSLIWHIISKSHPLWQVHAQSHLPRHIKIPPPLASTCTVSSSTSYQNPTPSGKYMHSLILHIISKSHPLWQVHAQSHLTHHIKIPPLWQVWRICSKTLWKPHVKADDMRPHREKGSCSNPPIRWSTRPSGCMNYYICFWNHSWRSIVCGSWFTKHSWRSIVCGSWFTKHSWRSIVYGSWFTIHSLRAMVYESWPSWFTNHGLRAMVYESWFTIHSLRAMVYEPWFTIHSLRAMVYRSRSQPINRYQ